MTIKNPETIKRTLRQSGQLEGLQFAHIYRFTSNGETHFAMFRATDYNDIYESPYVADPVALMENGKLTEEGKAFLK
jgi:hypothetical protein